MAWKLVGEHRGETLDLSLVQGAFTVGRGSDCGLVLPSPTVSRRHAEIEVTADGTRVRDLGSLNGTRVNGADASEPLFLHPGDRVEFGSVVLRVVDGEADPESTGTASVRWAEDSALSSSLERSHVELGLGAGGAPSLGADAFRLLTEAGQLLVLPESPDETYDRLLELVERVVPAGRVIFLETGETGEPVQRAGRVQGDRALSPLLLSRTMVRLVLDQRKSILTRDAQSDVRFMHQHSIVAQDLHSAMAVPLVHHDETFGVLYVDTNVPGHAYEEPDLKLFTLLGQMLGAKIANARLLKEARERARLEEELRTAASIQRRLLPQRLPDVVGYELRGMQETCESVGGDLYDAGLLPDGRLQIALGDVSGKGIGAALLMSDVLASLRALRPFGLPADETVMRLHRHLIESTEAERYVTLFLAEIDPVAHRLEYVNAGHPAARLLHPDGRVECLEATGVWVGLLDLPGLEFARRTVDFPPGAALVITSDGIDEATRGEEEFYAEVRLESRLAECAGETAHSIADLLLADVESFRSGAPAADDVTLVVIRRAP